jgi:hypothetical protein
MRAETWLPLVTFILGLAGAQITEMFRDRRTSDRERQAHDRERQVRQGELQRATLLDLQDALLELFKRTNELRTWRLPEGLWEHMSEDARANAARHEDEARGRMRDSDAKVELLGSRVLDADARQAVQLFALASRSAVPHKGMAGQMVMARPVDMTEVWVRYDDAIQRLGALIRERY